MTAPGRQPRRGELWASPTGDEFLVIAGLDGSRWLARPAAGADLAGWTLAQEADPGDPGYIAVPASNLGLRPMTGTTRALRTPGTGPVPAMAVWTKPDGTSGTIPAADLDAFTRYAATLGGGPPPITVDGPAGHDARLTATCPHCQATDLIAEISEQGWVAPLEFWRGTDNDRVYGSAPSASTESPAVRYLCTGCGSTVGVPLSISLVQ